jgi:hypothetical protein
MILYGSAPRPASGAVPGRRGARLLIGAALIVTVLIWCRIKGWGKQDGDGRLPFGTALKRPAGRC